MNKGTEAREETCCAKTREAPFKLSEQEEQERRISQSYHCRTSPTGRRHSEWPKTDMKY